MTTDKHRSLQYHALGLLTEMLYDAIQAEEAANNRYHGALNAKIRRPSPEKLSELQEAWHERAGLKQAIERELVRRQGVTNARLATESEWRPDPITGKRSW